MYIYLIIKELNSLQNKYIIPYQSYIFDGNVRFIVIIVVMVIVNNIGIEFSFIIIRVWLFGVCFSLYSKLPLCFVQIDFPKNI